MIDPSRMCAQCMFEMPEGEHLCPACGYDNLESENQPHQLAQRSILAGAYLVGRALGQGGFGVTYVGWDLTLDQKVAIKEYYPDGCVTREPMTHATILPMLGDKGEFFTHGRQKFVDEARVLAKFVDDPSIVNVRRTFQENGTAYIVMDFVEGRTLKQYAAEKGGRLSSAETLGLLRPLMTSLSHVHKAGLLHRDISPDNIMLQPDGTVKLLDFGAARQISAEGEKSLTINVKHGYAPEEQYRTHGEQGPWTDVYALAATIYMLTTGQLPPQALDRMYAEDAIEQPNSLGADFTETQQAALMRALAVRAEERTQDMEQLAASLTDDAEAAQNWLESNPPPVPAETAADGKHKKNTGKPRKRRPWLWAIFGPLLAALALTVMAAFIPSGRSAEASEETPVTGDSLKSAVYGLMDAVGAGDYVREGELGEYLATMDTEEIIDELEGLLNGIQYLSDEELDEEIQILADDYGIRLSDRQLTRLTRLARKYQGLDAAEIRGKLEDLARTANSITGFAAFFRNAGDNIQAFYEKIGQFLTGVFS